MELSVQKTQNKSRALEYVKSYRNTQLYCTKALTLNTKLICTNSFVHIIID